MIDYQVPAQSARTPAWPDPPSNVVVSTEDLLRERDALPAGHRGRIAKRNLAIEQNLAMAVRLAWRYRGRGVPTDDLNQVAALALIAAVDRFDSSRSTLFASFAIPTILGSLKRYFRDSTWSMRVPRATQELVSAITAAAPGLNQELGRTPSTADLAEHLHADVGDVVAAMGAFRAYRLMTLSAAGRHADSTAVIDIIGEIDLHFADLDNRLVLRPLMASLPAREQQILVLYYYGHMTQAGIAAEVGISQMHVSRLLKRALSTLRAGLEVESPAPEVVGTLSRRP